MPVQCLNRSTCLVIRAALVALTPSDEVRDSKTQVTHLHHHQGLQKIAVEGATSDRACGLNLKPALPRRVIGVNLETQSRHTVLAEEDGTLDLLVRLFSPLDAEPNCLKVSPQDCKNFVALQMLIAFEGSYGRFVVSEYLDHLWDEMGRGFGERERDEPNRCIAHLDSL